MNAGPRDGPEREFEEFLRRAGWSKPDPQRRARMRADFLAAARRMESPSRAPSGPRSEASMASEGRDPFELWLAAQGSATAPSPELRRRARAAFVGSFAGGRPHAPPARSSKLLRWLVPLAAAAAIVAVTFFLPEPDRWVVDPEGPVRFGGTEYAVHQARELAVELESAGTLSSPSAPTQFSFADVLDLKLLAGGELAFPELPELDGVTPIRFDLNHGEVYLRTSGKYPGNPIHVHTPVADVEVHGTTLGILVDVRGTCVCVARGAVSVASERLPDGPRPVSAGTTLLVFEQPAMMAKSMPFPTKPGEPDYEHVQELLAFLRPD